MLASVPDMKFRRLDMRDGLSNSQVNCIFRDSQGRVWIGTPYGLNRYDGYRIKSYFSHTADSLSMPASNVEDVMEDAEGNLWMRHGVVYSIFNPQTETFNRHPERWLQSMGVKGSIDRIYIDRRKQFWVKTYDQGVWYLNPSTRKVRHFPFGDGPQQFNADIGVSNMAEYGNSLVIVSNNGDLVCFNTRHAWISWKSHTLRRMGAEKDAGYFVTIDSDKNIWVIVEGRVYVWLRKACRWIDSADEALRYLGISGLPKDTKIWDIAVDKYRQLWLATDHQGLLVVNAREKSLRQFLNAKNDETSVSANTLRKIYRDQKDRMWIATYMNGVNYYAENLHRFRHVQAGNINTVCTDQEGNYWLGSDDQGIIRYNPTTGEKTVFNRSQTGLGSDVIVSSLAATDGTLWFGAYEGGLVQYKDGRFHAYKATGQSDRLVHNSVWALAEDQWGNIWLGTLGAGVQRIDRRTGRFTTLDDQTGLPTNYISSIQLTRDGWLLIAHTDFYSLVNPRTMEVRNSPLEELTSDLPLTPASNQVMEDSRGLIWQGTASGVTISCQKNGVCRPLAANAGLTGTVNGLVEDSRHTVWVIFQNSISNVIPLASDDGSWTFVVRSFNNRDGLQDAPFNQRSAVLSPDGKIIVGGHEGIDVIDPQRMEVAYSEDVPTISGVRMMDGPSMPVSGRLDLAYDENHFVIQLASNNGEVHNRSRFAYRMEGLNSGWLYTDENNANAVYTGLPSGRYTFCARMLNDDGTLGEKECRLNITIATPWYRSWWMLAVYVLLIAAGLYWHYKRYQEKMRLEKLKLQQESNHLLDEQRQKFNDMISDELRLPFHETFESLNSMMKRETDEQRYEQQQRVFTHLEELLQQVNSMVEKNHGQTKLVPQIKEVEISNQDEKLVRDATTYVEENLSNSDISVETMAEALAMSRVHLYKKLTAITDMTPSEFIRQIRLRHAEQLLRKSQMTVSEVAYKVGFNNPRYLTKYFKEMYGVMPSEYKKSAD